MGRFVKGEVVIVPYPFSDLTQTKRRPALVVAALPGDDVILCQMTSRLRSDPDAILIQSQDFARGALNQPGNVRPNRLFTADSKIVLYSAGVLRPDVVNRVIEAIVTTLRR
jgi:mRNA interferase MazF